MFEEKETIRGLWRCNAGWRMKFCIFPTEGEEWPSGFTVADVARGYKEVTYGYYPTIEECVMAEYARVVEGKPEIEPALVRRKGRQISTQ